MCENFQVALEWPVLILQVALEALGTTRVQALMKNTKLKMDQAQAVLDSGGANTAEKDKARQDLANLQKALERLGKGPGLYSLSLDR